MNIFAVCAFALSALFVVSLVKQLRQELVPLTVCAIGLILLTYILSEIAPLIGFIKETAAARGLGGYFSVLIKSLAIALCCQSCAEICRDCGESSLAAKVELAGKISIILISLPLLQGLMKMAGDLL